MFKRFVTAISIVCLPYVVDGQKVAELIVLDAYSGNPVEKAWVVVEDDAVDSLFTDANGKITDAAIRSANFIVVGKQGFSKDTLKPENPGIYRIYLYPNSRDLDEVAIVSEMPGGRKLETPIYGHRITFGKPYTFDGLQMAIAVNTIPNVQWEQRGIGGSARISVRGSGWRSNYGIRGTRIYYDNIPLSQPDGFGLPELVDPYFTESVEVLKGPSGSSYGGYAGGSLMLKSSNPSTYGLTFNLGVMAGSNRLLRAQAGASFTSRNFSVSASGMSMVHRGFRQQEYVNRKLYQAKANWQVHANHSLSFLLFYGSSNWGLPGDLTQEEADTNRRMANPYSLQAAARLEKEFVRSGFTYTAKQGEHFLSELSVFGSWTDKYNPYGTSVANNGIKVENLGGGGIRETLRFMYGRKITWNGNIGFEYQGEQLNGKEFQNNGGKEGTLKSSYKLSSHLFFLFAQSTIRFPAQIKLDFGGVFAINGVNKLDKPDSTTGEFRVIARPGVYPYLGLTKNIGKAYSVYAKYNSGYTTPTINELLSDDGLFNTGLKNETVHQLEVGTRGQALRAQFIWGLGGFAHFYRNYIVPYYPMPNSAVRYTNSGAARNLGVEAELDYYAYDNSAWNAPVSQIWLGLRYGYMYAQFTDFTDSGVNYNGKQIPGMPNHKVNFLFTVKTRYGFALQVDVSYRNKILLDYANTASVPGIFKGNMRLSWSGKLFSVLFPELFFGINNFSNAKDYSFYRVNAPGGRYLNPDNGIFFYGGVNFKTSSFFNRKEN